MTYTVTQAAMLAATSFFRDERTGLAVKFQLGQNPAPLIEAFAKFEAETLERAAEAHAEALTAKDADIARLREFEAGVGKFLEMLEHGYAPNIEAVLSDAMCCSGQMCGCRGASVGEYLAHLLRSDVGITRQAIATDQIETSGYVGCENTVVGDHTYKTSLGGGNTVIGPATRGASHDR